MAKRAKSRADMTREELRADFQRLFPGGDLCQYDGVCRKGGQQLIEIYTTTGMEPMRPYWFCEEHGDRVVADLAESDCPTKEGGELPSIRTQAEG